MRFYSLFSELNFFFSQFTTAVINICHHGDKYFAVVKYLSTDCAEWLSLAICLDHIYD
jgi:hypothetical protein